MALSFSVYGSCFDLESFARVNTSAAHIPQYLREEQSQILLKYSANDIFSFHMFLWDFTDTFLIFIQTLTFTFNKLERYQRMDPNKHMRNPSPQSHYIIDSNPH